jgi:GT2 family glycosyltransferase
VVLTWNNLSDTQECLESLAAQTYACQRLIVVDNGSRDGSIDALRSRWAGRADFVLNSENLGIGGGYNAGFRAALAAGADYVAMFNNDVLVAPAFLERLVAVLQADPAAAVAAPVITYYDDPDRVWFARISFRPRFGQTRHLYREGDISALGPLQGAVYESDYIAMAAAVLRRAALEEVGLFDESFFLSHEDLDWCLRARRAGRRCLVRGEALARHKVAVSRGDRGSELPGPRLAFHQARNYLLIGAKHYQGLDRLTYLAGQLLLTAPYQSARLVRGGRWRSVWPLARGACAALRGYARDRSP